MAVSSKTWTVGEIITAANLNTFLRDNLDDLQSNKVVMKTGTYTGDGEVSQAITGIGFTPVFIRIWHKETVGNIAMEIIEATDAIVGDGVSMAIRGQDVQTRDNRIIAVGADGFTVDDGGTDQHPNKNEQVYNYLVFGAE